MNAEIRQLKIVSGGQTGADRAGLDAALALGLPIGGWCPKGRRAEDGPIPDRYPLVETPEADYDTRTRRNVEDSDGTLILNLGKLDGGTALTAKLAQQIGKPCLVVALEDGIAPATFRDWLEANQIAVLNIAGPRESKRPGVYDAACRCLDESHSSSINNTIEQGERRDEATMLLRLLERKFSPLSESVRD